jgi:hypothetical protein
MTQYYSKRQHEERDRLIATPLTRGSLSSESTYADIAFGLLGGYAGYVYMDSIIPGIGGLWGFTFGSLFFGLSAAAVFQTAAGQKWIQSVLIAADWLLHNPLMFFAYWLTSLICFDVAWDYAFELAEPLFDIVFEFIPGGFQLWRDLNPYSGNFLGMSAIIAVLMTIGMTEIIAWPLSCSLWALCRMTGSHTCSTNQSGFPCPSAWFDYPCPNSEMFVKAGYWKGEDAYGLYSIPGDLIHMALIPLAIPLCLFLQIFNGVCDKGQQKRKVGFWDFAMLPVDILNEYMRTNGSLMLDIGYWLHNKSHIGHLGYHLFDELKCKSFNMGYCK